MENLSKLLERFAKVLNKDRNVKEVVSQVVLARTRVSLSHESISLKEGVLEINTSPAAKNEIRLKEEAILNELKELHKLPISRILYK